MQMSSVIFLSLVTSVNHVICFGQVELTYSTNKAIPNRNFTFTCAVHVHYSAFVVKFYEADSHGSRLRYGNVYQTRDGYCGAMIKQWPNENDVTCGLNTEKNGLVWRVYHYTIERVGRLQWLPEVTFWRCQASSQKSNELRFTKAKNHDGTGIELTASDSVLVPESTVELTCSVPKDKVSCPVITFYRKDKYSEKFHEPYARFQQNNGECLLLDNKTEFEMRCGEGTRESDPRVRKYHLVISREQIKETTWRCGTEEGETSNKVFLTSVT